MKTLRFMQRDPIICYTTNDKGQRQRVADRSHWHRLRVKPKDAENLHTALQWACPADLLDFALNVETTEDKHIVEFVIPGKFEPELNEEDVSQLVEDWRLLSPHFATRQGVFEANLPGKVVEIVLRHLLNGKQKPLPEWVMRMLKLREEG